VRVSLRSRRGRPHPVHRHRGIVGVDAGVDATFAKALAAGATEVSPVQDQFYGDRSGQLEDPWGHRWNVATHVEDVPPEEMEARAAKAMGG
jgi:PhnB protein